MREKGTLITCDCCDDKGVFIRVGSYDIYPDGWEFRDGKDICPKCVEEMNRQKQQIDIFNTFPISPMHPKEK